MTTHFNQSSTQDSTSFSPSRTHATKITINPWIDSMPGCGTGELMCQIEFNKQLATIKIKKIYVYNHALPPKTNHNIFSLMFAHKDENKQYLQYIHNTFLASNYKYEIRHDYNMIIIREGPRWTGVVHVEVLIEEEDGNEIMLVSEPENISRCS